MTNSKFLAKYGMVMLIILFTLFHPTTAESWYSKAACSFARADTQAPTAPKGLTAANVTLNSVVLAWKPSADNIGVKGYEIYCNGKKIATTPSISYEYKKLSPGAAYLFYIKAYDKAGNYSAQSSSIPVNTEIDNIAPSTPGGLKASSVSETEIALIWTPASDNIKVRGYEILRNGVKISTTSKTTYNSKSLIPNKSYTYAVRAVDTSGNLSGNSKQLSVTTLQDTLSPSAPAKLRVAAIKGTSVSLEWIASTDNSKVAGYQIYCNGIVIATAAGTSRIVKSPFGLDPDTYFIKAYDIAGNLSACSNTITAATASE